MKITKALSSLSLLTSLSVFAQVPLVSLGTDSYLTPGFQHATTVEPDTFSFGSTIVAAYQAGRAFDGGATNIKFARSGNSGGTWINGALPGITKAESGFFDRASDPSVAFDARHNVWLISTLGLVNTPNVHGDSIVVSRSTDGGVSWNNPIQVTARGGDVDKNWIVCDNTSTSPFFGRCYHQWDDVGLGGRMRFSFSTDGGLTWSAPRSTADRAMGLAGQPLVRPNGTIVVPFTNSGQTQIRVVRSLDGGVTFRNSFSAASIIDKNIAGLRSAPLPSAEISASGRVFISWQDCRFQPSCRRNDIVFISSLDGLNWSSVRRVPIHAIGSNFDHFIPGLGVDRTTSGSTARLGLTYYFYPNGECGFSTCSLNVGFISSSNGGSTWSVPTTLAGPMSLSWLANTSQGRMVGDYISTSWAGGTAHPAFAIASAPVNGVFNERMVSTASGLGISDGEMVAEEWPEEGVRGQEMEDNQDQEAHAVTTFQ